MNTTPTERRLLVCNCNKTMSLDADKLASWLDLDETPTIHRELCRSQISSFERQLEGEGPLLVACTQEAPFFDEVAEARNFEDLRFVNIRERAGWCDAPAKALPKIAALIAEALPDAAPTGTTTLKSGGLCLVYGKGQTALDVAEELNNRLSVTLVLSDPGDALPPNVVSLPIFKGRIVQAAGTLGGFKIRLDNHAPAQPYSKKELVFDDPQDGVSSKCDLLFDLTGDAPLLSAHGHREGYFRADPDHPAAIARAMFKITDMVGEFEKPLFVDYDPDICAHGRSEKIGCSNCLDNCPAGAITPDGDNVSIDPALCGGCGMCSALCPTGAASYALPRAEDLITRVQVMLRTYELAGGADPLLLVHEEKHGSAMISALARYGRGLPPNVLPVSVYSVTQVGHDLLCAFLAAGANRIFMLTPPNAERLDDTVLSPASLANAFMQGLGLGDEERVIQLEESDPDVLEALLYDQPKLDALPRQSFVPDANKRNMERLVLAKLHEASPSSPDAIPLPAGAPYGRVNIDGQGCTLCLACVSACPTAALYHGEERPQLRFTESACVQCGLCRVTCPEHVITLEPRYDFTAAAQAAIVLNEEEPFECVRCGKPFGTKSSIERVVGALEGKHWMFKTSEKIETLKMCEDCRVIAMAESSDDPFKLGEIPRPRTAADYIIEDEEPEEQG